MTKSDPDSNFNQEILCCRKTWRHHLSSYLKSSWVSLGISLFSTVISLGGLLGLIIALGISPPNPLIYILLVCFILISLAHNIYKYTHTFPRGFENETPLARRLAQHWPIGWEARLAKELLQQRLYHLNIEFDNIKSKREFVRYNVSFRHHEDYLSWIDLRYSNLHKMLGTASKLLYNHLLPSMYHSDGSIPLPTDILNATNSIDAFFREIIEFERDARRTQLPAGCEKQYDLQFNWTYPIRNLFEQFLHELDVLIATSMASKNLHSPPALQRTIVIDSSSQVEEWLEELRSEPCRYAWLAAAI